MILNHLILNRLTLSLLFAISLPVALVGCQSTSVLNPQQTVAINTAAIQNNSKLTDETAVKNALPTQTDLSITNELLERYHWLLVSAMSNTYDDNKQLTRAPIGDFYHPSYPVSVSFASNIDSRYVYFSSNCNGSGATYTLLEDNTLRVASIVSTDMGCGETGNGSETALFKLMQDSSSKITLSLQPPEQISTSSKNQVDFPRYNLLQTMVSGETLVWQNAIKETP